MSEMLQPFKGGPLTEKIPSELRVKNLQAVTRLYIVQKEDGQPFSTVRDRQLALLTDIANSISPDLLTWLISLVSRLMLLVASN